MRTKNRARRAIFVARRARDLSAKAEKSLQEKCDFKHGRAEYKADSRAAGVTGPNTYLLISQKHLRKETARSSPKYTVLNNPVGKKLAKQISGTSKVPEKMQKKAVFLSKTAF